MFACLHGSGALTALAHEFSPLVEESGGGSVTFDVSGLDRLFGHPQELAAAPQPADWLSGPDTINTRVQHGLN